MGNTLSFLPCLAVPRATDHTLVQHSKPDIGCTFFDRLPLEVRRQIYKYLLVNPMLGDSAIELHTKTEQVRGGHILYGLSTSILYTSQQAYREASSVLYECNTFYIYCFTQEYYWNEWYNDSFCPLTRYRRYYHQRYFSLMDEKSAFKVRHWKILLSTIDGPSRESDNSLIDVCKLMSVSRPQSLEILVIPRGMEAEPGDEWYGDINVVLKPLHLLRFPEGRFSIRDANLNELYDHLHRKLIVPVYLSRLDETSSHNALANLITSNVAVEIGADMYSRLLIYTRCFERYLPFKAEMGLKWNENLGEEESQSLDPRYFLLKFSNPFRFRFGTLLEYNLHPIEDGLAKAKIDTEIEDLAAFKEKRAATLEYLEPQYQRIMDASSSIRQFIKRHKQYGSIFGFDKGGCVCCQCEDQWDPYRHHDADTMAEGLVHLEQYVAAFRRDAPFEVQIEIKKQQRDFEHHYFAADREELLAKMNREFEMSDCEHYVEHFKRVFNHMEAQRIEIIKARKELFKFDLTNDRRCEIDPELERSEDLVDWDVYDEVEVEDEEE